MTSVESENLDKLILDLSKAGFPVSTEKDSTYVQVYINTIFWFGQQSANNVEENLNKVMMTMMELNKITNREWFLASSHPMLVDKYYRLKENKG